MSLLSARPRLDKKDREVSQTSLSSYFSMIECYELQQQESLVYGCLKQYPNGLTRKEISKIVGLDLSSVCGRVKSLLDRHLLVKSFDRLNFNTKKRNEVIIINKYT